MKKLDYDFRHGTGAAMLEWDSNKITRLKILNEIAFEKFQSGEWSARDMFTHESHRSHLNTVTFGPGMIGEFFSNVSLGRDVEIGANANIVAHGGITIGDRVKIGNDVQFVTVFHSLHPQQRLPIRTSPIIIEDGAEIGDGSLIISSRRNGRPLVIGPNVQILPESVVIHDVPAGMVGGRPASWIDRKNILPHDFHKAAVPIKDLRKIETIHEAKSILGASAEAGLPVYLAGRGSIEAEGFYLVNRDSRLLLDGKLTVGADVLMGPSVTLKVGEGAALHLDRNVWLGAGASITVPAGQNIFIGRGSIIAAGTSITRSVVPNSVMTGVDGLKKKITMADFDRSIPDNWMDAAYCVRDMDYVATLKKEILQSVAMPQDLKCMIREAYSALDDAPEQPMPSTAKHALNPL